MPREPRILVDREGAVGLLTLDHPPENRLTSGMFHALKEALASLEKEAAVHAVVVVGAGGHFSGGLEWEEWSRRTPKEAQEEIQRGFEALWSLEHLPKPTVAAISGHCIGAGAELSLACDLRIASEDALFAHPEVDLSWMPSHGGTARLARLVGRPAALEILASGKKVKALDAFRLGIVDHLTAPGEALPQAKALAQVFAQKPPAAVQAIKRALTEGEEKPYRNRFVLEAQHSAQLLSTDAYKEAMARLRAKRP